MKRKTKYWTQQSFLKRLEHYVAIFLFWLIIFGTPVGILYIMIPK